MKQSWGGDSFPKDHWIHKAVAKEKDRMAKKAVAGKGAVAAPVAGGLNVKSKPLPMANMQPQMGGSGNV